MEVEFLKGALFLVRQTVSSHVAFSPEPEWFREEYLREVPVSGTTLTGPSEPLGGCAHGRLNNMKGCVPFNLRATLLVRGLTAMV
jgi:hypothetical protein